VHNSEIRETPNSSKYERNRQWDEMNTFGQAKACELNLSEADVEPAVREVRQDRRNRSAPEPKK
jgi:hypothetical protein